MGKRSFYGGIQFAGLLMTGLLALAGIELEAAPRFEVSLESKVVCLGESTNLKLVLIGVQAGNSLTLPGIPDLRVQLLGRGSSTIIDNGVRTVSQTYTFRVQPLRVGDIRIPGMTLNVDGKPLASQPLVLKVVPRGTVLPEDKYARMDFFAKIETGRTNVFIGEPFLITLKLFYTAGRNLQAPDLSSEGFTFTDLPNGQEQQRFGGKIFNVLVFQKVALPVKTGGLKIGPCRFPFTHATPRGRGFIQSYTYTDVKPIAPAVEVSVKPLPSEGKPEGFDGAVGSYKMDVIASPTNLTAGDPITLQVRFTGKGALENIRLPSFSDWKDFKVYPSTDNVNYTDLARRVGNRMFEQVVVPGKADISLPGFEFSFFDPARGSYETLVQPPLALSVAPAAKVQSAPVIMLTQTNQTDDTVKLVTELVHIKPHLGVVHSVASGKQSVWVFPLATFLAWISMWLRRRRIERLEYDPRLRRRLATDRLIAAELGRLKGLAEEENGKDFFKLLVTLLQERLGERLDLPASGITENVVVNRLKPAGVPAELLATIEKLFDVCNQAHYAPDMAKAELKQLAEDAGKTMAELKEVEL